MDLFTFATDLLTYRDRGYERLATASIDGVMRGFRSVGGTVDCQGKSGPEVAMQYATYVRSRPGDAIFRNKDRRMITLMTFSMKALMYGCFMSGVGPPIGEFQL